MKKQPQLIRSEQGQSIVFIAVLMVGLLALAGLALDGGNLYLQRRNVQNAADSASLAGTRLLAEAICGESDATDAEITATVAQYAERNGVHDLNGVTAQYTNIEETVLGEVGAGTIPVGSTGVDVAIEDNVPSYFIKVVGIDSIDVGANALAMTAPPDTAGGLRPVAVPLPLMEELEPGEPFTLNFGNCVNKPEDCTVEYTGGQMQHRGWLNLAYVWNQGEDPTWPRAVDPSGNANVLKDWMENGFPPGTDFYSDCVGCWYGDYIHAKPGQNSSVIGESPVGSVIVIPIFDNVPHYDDIPEPKPAQASQGGGYYYHIVGFMAFEVTYKAQGGGEIGGEFVSAILGEGQVGSKLGTGFGEGDACKTHLQAINLWR